MPGAKSVAAAEFCADGQLEYINPAGEKVCQEIQESQEGKNRGCMKLPERLAKTKKCLFCPLFKTLYKAAQTMAQISYEKTGIPIRNVMVIGFAVYIAFAVLGHVSAFTKQDAPKFLTDLLVITFKVIVAFLLLSNGEEIYNWVINPLLAAGLDFGSAMLFQSGGSSMAECKANAGSLTGILPDGLYDRLECYIKAIQDEISFAQATGDSLMCFGRKEASGWFGIWDFSMVFQGVIIYLCALLLSFAFAFYLIDSVVQLGIVGAMMAFLIACWPFKMTSGFTGKGFNMILNTFFIFIFMGIVVSINFQLIGEAMTSGGLGALEGALNGNNIDKLKEMMDWTFGSFLILICCCIFGFKFSAQAAALAGQMAGGGGAEIGSKIGGMVASPVVKGAKKIGGQAIAPITSATKRGIAKAYDATKDAISNPFRAGQKAVGSFRKNQGRAMAATGKVQSAAGKAMAFVGLGAAGNELKASGDARQQKGEMYKKAGQSVIDQANAGAGKSKDDPDYMKKNTPGAEQQQPQPGQPGTGQQGQTGSANPQSGGTPGGQNPQTQPGGEAQGTQPQPGQAGSGEQGQPNPQPGGGHPGTGQQGQPGGANPQPRPGQPGGGQQQKPHIVIVATNDPKVMEEHKKEAKEAAQRALEAYKAFQTNANQYYTAYTEAKAAEDIARKRELLAQEALNRNPGNIEAARELNNAHTAHEQAKLQTSEAETNIKLNTNALNTAAVDHWVNNEKARETGNGHSFDETAYREKGYGMVNTIRSELDNIIAAQPRP